MLKRIKKKMRFAGKAGEKDTNKCNAGFSLIEVIAVTIIIGVMATMLMPAIDGAGSKARNAKLKNDLATLDQAIATYKLDREAFRPLLIIWCLVILPKTRDSRTRKTKTSSIPYPAIITV